MCRAEGFSKGAQLGYKGIPRMSKIQTSLDLGEAFGRLKLLVVNYLSFIIKNNLTNVILCFILGHENAGTGTHGLILIFMKKFQNEANIVRGGTILRSIACVRWHGMKMPFLAAWLCAVTSSLVAAPFA